MRRDGENKSHISEKQKRFIFRGRAGQEFARAGDLPVGLSGWSGACVPGACIGTKIVQCTVTATRTSTPHGTADDLAKNIEHLPLRFLIALDLPRFLKFQRISTLCACVTEIGSPLQ
jgi:hypothetical protein